MMQKDWQTQGCAVCRANWEQGLLPELLAVNKQRQASLYRCDACGSYWEEYNRYATVIPSTDVATLYPDLQATK